MTIKNWWAFVRFMLLMCVTCAGLVLLLVPLILAFTSDWTWLFLYVIYIPIFGVLMVCLDWAQKTPVKDADYSAEGEDNA